jgi:hypothetical protein
MAMTPVRRWSIVLGGIGLLLPVLVLAPRLAALPAEPPPPEPVDWQMPPALAAALARPLFGAAEGERPTPVDAPDLVGIAGRIGSDAVAMVRGGDGSVRVLKPGEAIDGWELRSIAIDAAYFTRGAQQARVPLGSE